jgi:hypothetical protein
MQSDGLFHSVATVLVIRFDGFVARQSQVMQIVGQSRIFCDDEILPVHHILHIR